MKNNGKIYVLDKGMGEVARPFTPDESAYVAADLDLYSGGAAADLFVAGDTSSSFDLAWQLVEQGSFGPWAGALALTQGAGRGQLRRTWFSPQGNLHVSFRLPKHDIFSGGSASVILGLLFCEAFADLGLPLFLKWPNDLVLDTPRGPGKLGGMLIEEKNGVLIAGLGINIAHLPAAKNLRYNAALAPALLPEYFKPRSPVSLWLTLVQSLIMIYTNAFMATSHITLLHRAESRLLWRGREVRVSGEPDDADSFCGVITGLSDTGGLTLLTRGSSGCFIEREISSGSIAGL